MPMAMGHQFRNPKKKVTLLFNPVFNIKSGEHSMNTNTNSNAFKREVAHDNDKFVGVVRSLCKQGRLKEALTMLNAMDQRAIPVDFFTYVSLLQGCIDKNALSEGKLVHIHITDKGFVVDRFLGNTLVNMYAKCGSLVEARRVFDQMPKRNVVSWTVMIAAYAKHGYSVDALALFHQMQHSGVQPNQFTFASVLPACANLVALKEVHEQIIRSGFQSDVILGNALVDMYIKRGSIEDARHVFDKMPERNVVSWTAMVSGYAQNGFVEEALKFFQKMPQRNVVSWNAMISGYLQNGYVDEAMKLFQSMPIRDLVSWSTMIAGYAKNGLVDEGLKLFEGMPERDVVSWTAMIAGYAQNGYFDKALHFFSEMELAGVKPNRESFASVLPACANLAALQLGKVVHEDIIRSGFESDVFVGSALVDMYAKCGSIENACRVFDKISTRDVVLWNAMIIGYAMHGCGREALQLFEQLQRSGTNPNHVTFVGVLSACCHAGLVDDGCQYFECMSRDYHVTPGIEHHCCMVDLLGRAGRLNEAEYFINKMAIEPTADMWGSLLGACRLHTNIELGERVAQRLFELEPDNAAPYVLLSNIYAAAGRWDDIEKVRDMLKTRKVNKKPGCSWIEVNKQVHAFLAGDRSHPQMQKMYTELDPGRWGRTGMCLT
eukprot:Gb_15843 [translate_table: standard]